MSVLSNSVDLQALDQKVKIAMNQKRKIPEAITTMQPAKISEFAIL